MLQWKSLGHVIFFARHHVLLFLISLTNALQSGMRVNMFRRVRILLYLAFYLRTLGLGSCSNADSNQHVHILFVLGRP